MNSETTKEKLAEVHDDCYRWALFCAKGQREVALEIIQSVYLKIYEGKAVFDETRNSAFKSWIFSVIRYTYLDLRRKEGRYSNEVNLSLIKESGSNNVEKELNLKERNMLMTSLLSALSEKQSEILRLVFYHDLTIEEASEVMSVQVGTARTHYERGKAKLKKLIETSRIKDELINDY